MSIIALNRRFLEWHEGGLSDPELVRLIGRHAESPTWEAISARRRVVILAEAGSGKTAEMQEQARLRSSAGEFAFYATVQDVGRDGLDAALRPEDQIRLAAWRADLHAEAWFFVDSIDEAKAGGIRLTTAVRRIAAGISGRERMAHVVLSGRLTDWEFRRDLERLNDGLPIPSEPAKPTPPTADELLTRTLRQERKKKEETPAEEKAAVYLLAPLDEEQVRKFAAAKGVPNVDAFLAQIDAANLWRFAKRPLDLDWLVEFWQSHGRLGSLAEMLKNSLIARVRETNPDRSRVDGLDETRASLALERIGAALVFGRKATIAIPDSELALGDEERPLDIAQVLPDWTPEDRAHLLTRPAFDPATFGRARLHNDNQGVVRGYLAAQWLHRLSGNNLPHGELFDLIFATTYGIDLIKPSMQETAAWLAIADEVVAREIVRRDASLLMTAGDPASLPVGTREAVLNRVLEQQSAGDRRLPMLDHDSLRRFASPDLTASILALWSKYHSHPRPRQLLLQLIWLGRLPDCANLAVAAGFGAYTDRDTMMLAGKAIAAIADEETKRRYVEFVKSNCTTLPIALIWDAIGGLFPQSLSVDDLLAILGTVDITDAGGGLSFEWQSPTLIERVADRSSLPRLLRGLLDQLGPPSRDIGHVPDKREETYFAAIAAAATQLLKKSGVHEAPMDAVDAALELGVRCRYGRTMHELPDVASELHRSPERRRAAFWRAAEALSGRGAMIGREIDHPQQMSFVGYQPNLRLEDVDWLLADAPMRPTESQRRLAMHAAMMQWKGQSSPELLAKIEHVARTDPVMSEVFDNWLNPPPPSPEMLRQHEEMERIQRQGDEQ